MKRPDRRRLGVLALLVAPSLWAANAHAAGAVAVGFAPGGAQKGFSFGISADKPTEAEARDAALGACRGAKDSNDAARSQCILISTFNNECAAIAMDPKSGTPGVGWAIAADSERAKDRALASCEATAGKGRAGTCKISSTRCYGGAK